MDMKMTRLDKATTNLIKYKEVRVLVDISTQSINSLTHYSSWLDLDDETKVALNKLTETIRDVSSSLYCNDEPTIIKEYVESKKEVEC